jgi:hypothetical protein
MAAYQTVETVKGKNLKLVFVYTAPSIAENNMPPSTFNTTETYFGLATL